MNDPIVELVIGMLASSELENRERVVSLESDNATYRELTCAAFDALRHLTVENRRLRESNRQLRDEYRALREQRLLEAGADDDEGGVAA